MAINTMPATAEASAATRRWRWLLSLAILAALWQVAAVLADSATLPSPAAVAAAAWQHLVDGDLLRDVAITLARVVVAFVVAMVLGSVIGLALGRSRLLDELFDGWLVIALNMPALVTIVLCYVWFGLNEAAAVLAVAINKAPLVVAITRKGARTLDRSLLEDDATVRRAARPGAAADQCCRSWRPA